MKKFLDFDCYLWVLAHPDDEVYTCALMKKVAKKARVSVVYITSGDYRGPEMIDIREAEAKKSMALIGVSQEDVHFLRIPERELMDSLNDVHGKLSTLATDISPGCVVTHDFEGGHNGHDAVSYLSFRLTRKLGTLLYFFPAYNGWPETRRWNQLVRSETNCFTYPLDTDAQNLKLEVINCHQSQTGFFDLIKQSDDYKEFVNREIVCPSPENLNYNQPPSGPVGYEFPGSTVKFADFKQAIGRIH